jgi:hypothetical protein
MKIPTYEQAEKRFFAGTADAIDDLIYHDTPNDHEEAAFRERVQMALDEAQKPTNKKTGNQ